MELVSVEHLVMQFINDLHHQKTDARTLELAYMVRDQGESISIQQQHILKLYLDRFSTVLDRSQITTIDNLIVQLYEARSRCMMGGDTIVANQLPDGSSAPVLRVIPSNDLLILSHLEANNGSRDSTSESEAG